MITSDEKMKVLLCEDDENLGMLLREYLQERVTIQSFVLMVKLATRHLLRTSTTFAYST